MANRYQDQPFSADDEDRGHDHARPKGEGDPLAELARLIGQTDPFANFGKGQQAPHHDDHQQPEQDDDDAPSSPPPWMQRANAHGAAKETTRQDFEPLYPAQRYADEHEEAEPEYHQAPAFAAADHQHQADPDRYDQALYGELPGQHAQDHDQAYQDDAYDYPDGYADEAEQPVQKRRGGMMTVAMVLALAVVGTGAAFGYRTYLGSPRSGEPPVIKADTSPNKVVPASTSADANSKLIQDRVGGAAPEKMVSREEQPVNVQDATKAGPRVVFPPLNVNSNPPSTASVSPAAKPMTAPPSVQAGDEPRKVKTMLVRGDQDPNATPAAKQLPKQAPARTAANVNANASAPLSLSPQAAAQAAPAAAPTRVANNAPTQIAPAPAAGGGYLVQIASQRNESEAQASFRALQGKYPSVLGSRTALIKRADLGEKGVYYRAMVGPFGSPDEATSFCGNLKSAGGQCVVQRN